jgi:dTDP-4-dehydrorhamnose 3,5-epimerase
MPFIATPFKDLWIFEPKVLEDSRGYFFESFNQKDFENATNLSTRFVQDNQSKSDYGVLRGLHFQKGEFAQAKLVRVLSGAVLDVVLDIRKNSATFGQHFSIELSATNHKQLFVPRGFAHGFAVISEKAEFFYKCDNYYAPKEESGIIFNDTDLQIDWQIATDKLIISDKDWKLQTWKEFNATN